MPESNLPLPTDLETLVANPPEDPSRLLAALVDEFYAPLFALAQAQLDDPQEAQFATMDAYIAALRYLDKHGRPPLLSALSPAPREDDAHARARIWLYGLALDAIRKDTRRLRLGRILSAALPARRGSQGGPFPETALEAELWLACDALSRDDRLTLFLHAAQGWSLSDIALLLRHSEIQAKKHLDSAHKALQRALKKAVYGSQALLPDELEPAVAKALCRRWPAAPLVEPQRSAILEELVKQAAR